MPRKTIFCALLIAAASAGCLEVKIQGALNQDGSGTLQVGAVYIPDLVDGKYAEVAKNDILPLNEAEVHDWVGQLDGVRLLAVDVQDIERKQLDRVGGLRKIQYQVAFEKLEAFTFDQVRFAYYPYGDRQVFQFIVEKLIPEGDAGEERGELHFGGSVFEPLTKDRYIHLEMDFPAKIGDTNARSVDWATGQWRIPLRALLENSPDRVIAWAEMPRPPSSSWFSWMGPMWYWATGQGWRDPSQLPAGMSEADGAAEPGTDSL